MRATRRLWPLAYLCCLAAARKRCHRPAVQGVVGLAVLKQPRVGSTWVKKEINTLPDSHLEFEPLTDGAHRCGPEFTNGVLGHLLREPLRCVNRKSRAKHCYWVKANCSVSTLLTLGGSANKSASQISGFLIHHNYVPSADWPLLLRAPNVRLVILRRTNIIKRTVSNMLRVAEEEDEPPTPSTPSLPSRAANGSVAPRMKSVKPSELLRLARLSMLSLVRMPDGIAFGSDDHFLLLYEDLQVCGMCIALNPVAHLRGPAGVYSPLTLWP